MLKFIRIACSIVILWYLPAAAQKRGQERIDSLNARIQQMRGDTNSVTSMLELTWELLNVDKKDEAQTLLGRITQLSDSLHFAFGQASALRFRGFLTYASGDRPAALKMFYTALDISKKYHLRHHYAKTLFEISRVLSDQGTLTEAEAMLREALAIFQEFGDKSSMANCYSNLSVIAEARHEFTVMKQNLNHVLQLHHELGDSARIAGTLSNLGATHFHTKEYQQSIDYFLQALAIFEQLHMTNRVAGISNDIGETYLITGKYALSRMYLKKSYELISSSNDKGLLLNYYHITSRLDSAEGKWQDAYRHRNLYISLRDAITREENATEVLKTQLNYEFTQKENLAKAEQEKKDALTAVEIGNQKRIRNITLGGLCIVVCFLAYVYSQRKKIAREKNKSDALLLNILPSEVAEELKAKGTADAKQFDNVTVLFTDFKSFTTISEALTPQELVGELHTCFKAFDEICTKYSIEKIKTIGDAYLAVCGLPLADEQHAENVVNAALEIREFMANRSKELGAKTFEIRIGINSGSVVAGIVGVKKFAYDIWGDTVNTAARMEQHSEAGKINISETTYTLVKDTFACEFRGEIDAKNKGKLKMYFVEKL
ncbi:MAG: adenylate/guanylate cyclase domain-containing protein [Candidatus Kapaibacterium sp.]